MPPTFFVRISEYFRQMKTLFSLVFLIAVSSGLSAQVSIPQVDLSAAAGAESQSVSLSALTRQVPVGKSKWKVHAGVRASWFGKSDAEYTTAPSQITTGSFGPWVILMPDKEENIDTFTVASTNIGTINLMAGIGREITEKLSFEFSIDVAGVSFGSVSDPVSSADVALRSAATPSRWNLLILSDSDFGSLNSEFSFMYLINRRIKLRGGFHFNFTELRSDETLQTFPEANRRFRSKTGLPFAAVRFSL